MMSRVLASLPEHCLGVASRGVGRRWVFAAAAVAITGSALGIAFALRPSPGPSVPRSVTSSAHVGKLSVSIPRGFSWYVVPAGSAPQVPGYAHVLTNFRVLAPHTAGPPLNQVGIELQRFINFAHVRVRLHLPLSPNQPWDIEPANCAVVCHAGLFRASGRTYLVQYWNGPKAPPGDRVAILRALRSIRATR
jgi:hypothetical protein